MREPIIVEADDGFHFIATQSFAEMSLEAIDITNNEYTCYDAGGFKLLLAQHPTAVASSPPRQFPLIVGQFWSPSSAIFLSVWG